MAERRMFTRKITESDAFLDMPSSTQMLYFHLAMNADDDGFVNNPKQIQRMCMASEDDLRVLLGKKFVIAFESGVIVIKHWRMHNYIRSDRYKPTDYEDEMKMLSVKENNAYTVVSNLDTNGIPTVSVGKDSIDKDSIGKVRIEEAYFPAEPEIDAIFKDYVEMRKRLKKPMTSRAIELAKKKLLELSGEDRAVAQKILEQSIMNSWQGLFPLKEEKKTSHEEYVERWNNL